MKLEIRAALSGDSYAIATLYNDIIKTTTAIYSEQPVSAAYMEAWRVRQEAKNQPVFVAYKEGCFAGYASYGQFREQPGFRHTVEHSVHVKKDARRQGVGRALMEALIEHAQGQNHHVMVGAVDAANADSLIFHARQGFKQGSVLPQVGQKGDEWLDVIFMYRRLKLL